MWLLGFLFPLAALAQNFYGPSQLDQYARLLNSRNLGGFGWFQEALNQGTVRNFGDLDGASRLQGLPPLPLTHDEVMRQLTSTPPPTTTPATARPTRATTPPPMAGIYAVNTAPEMPPRPEEKIHGKYDDDGVFHPDEDEKLKRNQIQGTKIREFLEKADQPQDDVNEYEADEFYDDPSLRVEQRRITRQQKSTQRTTSHRVSHDIKPRQIRPPQPQPARPQQPQQRPQQPPQPFRPPQPQYPTFVFQPKGAATGREAALNNLLTEIEEYDDFLDQHQSYKERFPSSGFVPNPYRLLPEGQLPTLPRAIQYQPQPVLPQQPPPQPQPQQAPPQQQFAPIPAVHPQQQQVAPAPHNWLTNGAPAHAAGAQTATEHPLLSIFNLFRVPQAHASPTFNVDGGLQIPLVDINQRPLGLGGLFTQRR